MAGLKLSTRVECRNRRSNEASIRAMDRRRLGIGLEFQGQGIDEQAIVTAIADPDKAPAIKVGDCVVRVDPRYFRSAEVETLLGDPSRARERLGWVPEFGIEQMVAEMVAEDLDAARRHALLKARGHRIPIAREDSH